MVSGRATTPLVPTGPGKSKTKITRGRGEGLFSTCNSSPGSFAAQSHKCWYQHRVGWDGNTNFPCFEEKVSRYSPTGSSRTQTNHHRQQWGEMRLRAATASKQPAAQGSPPSTSPPWKSTSTTQTDPKPQKLPQRASSCLPRGFLFERGARVAETELYHCRQG